MRVYVIRHGDDGSSGANGSDRIEDEDPDLTPEGRDTIDKLAEWMLENNEVPNIIYASPMSRTQQTAELLASRLGVPVVKTDVSVGPDMSIRGRIKELAADDDVSRPAIVSHNQSIRTGLRALDQANKSVADSPAMGELRIIKVDREDGTWKEKNRVRPSDLGQMDRY
jgi:broad specificity phosphatase PhoE